MKLDSVQEDSDSVSDTLTHSGSHTTSTIDTSEFDPLSQSYSSTGSKVTVGKGDVDISQLTGGFMSGSSTSLDSSSSNVSTPKRKVRP